MTLPRFRSVPTCSRSLGPQIARFAKTHGMTLDPWQRQVLDDFSGLLEGGGFASPSNYLLVARQNGMSEIAIARALYGLFKLRRRMTLFSSHQWASSNEVFLRMKAVIEQSPELAEQVRHTRLSAAQLGFELHDGGRILFRTRSRAAARGFSCDEINFDECHFLPRLATRRCGRRSEADRPKDQSRRSTRPRSTRLATRTVWLPPACASVASRARTASLSSSTPRPCPTTRGGSFRFREPRAWRRRGTGSCRGRGRSPWRPSARHGCRRRRPGRR
jgi:hypothetical protein